MSSGPLRFISPQHITLERVGQSLTVRAHIQDDRCVISASLKRVFPLSKPDGYITLEDGAGKEVGLISGIEGLDPDSRKIVEEELDRRYFTPKIDAILGLVQEGGIWTFDVRTQRGPARFYVRNWRDSAHEIQPGRWQIRSVDGQRYEIPNTALMDKRSLDHLERVF